MQYTRAFTMNGRSPSAFTSPRTAGVVFKDTETGKEYGSFYEMLQDFNYEDYATTDSFGTVEYHRAGGISFVWTDGVKDIVDRNEVYWLLDLINSYFVFNSHVIVKYRGNGQIEFVANPLNVPDYCDTILQISIVKLSEDTALFSLDVEMYDRDKGDFVYKTIGCQYIPYTDMKDDYVYLFAENGVILYPQEH